VVLTLPTYSAAFSRIPSLLLPVSSWSVRAKLFDRMLLFQPFPSLSFPTALPELNYAAFH
jgi:hypothetical protein